jgi:hypothetical protein
VIETPGGPLIARDGGILGFLNEVLSTQTAAGSLAS